jgi:hypothetical protein
MDRLATILVLIVLIATTLLFVRITGLLAYSSITIFVKEKMSGKILLAYEPTIQLGNSQPIYTEFINTGTNAVTAKIEIRVHIYTNGSIKPLAYYYDSPVLLNPGMRRSYKAAFVPPDAGLYYIQARASYDTRVVETWGAFSVYYPPAPPQPPQVVYQPITPPPTVGPPRLSLECPGKINITKGTSELISTILRNVGGVDIHDLRFYVSTTGLINFTINPKQASLLGVNRSIIVLVSVDVPEDVPEGEYPLTFEVMSSEVKESCEISLEIISAPAPAEEVCNKIPNYRFLIIILEGEIASAFSQGFDVSLANRSLSNAKMHLSLAEDYCRLRDFENAKKELENVKRYLQDATLQLESATLFVYRPPAFAIPWILILIVIIIVLILVYLYYRKKRGLKRPRLLREATTEEK